MLSLRINRLRVSVLTIAFVAFSAIGHADDITDSINEALQYYKNGEYGDAVGSLNYASRLIQQKKGKGLESFLPEPLSGWNAQKGSSQIMGTSTLGGGIIAERKYTKKSGSINIQIITDSPFTQFIMMMFTNPVFITLEGGRFEKIGHQNAIIKYDSDNRRGEIKIVVANRFLVSIEGEDVTEEELRDYADAVDYKKLQSLP